MTANVFRIDLSTASKIIHAVCKTITGHLGSKYIRLPRTRRNDSKMIPTSKKLAMTFYF